MTDLAVHRVGSERVSYVFLNGLFGQGRNWSSIARALVPATSLLVDLPDHGESPRTTRIDYEAMADAVAATLERVGAHDHPVTLVGHSMGGKVAMLVALRRRDLLRRLVVEDIAPVASDMQAFRVYIDAMTAIDTSAIRTRREADDALAQAVPDPRVRGFLLQGLRPDPEGGWHWMFNLDLLSRQLDAVGDWPSTHAYEPFPGPVLWLAGQQSSHVRAQDLTTMRALFPRVRLVTVMNAGHWIHADVPEVFVSALRQFVALT